MAAIRQLFGEYLYHRLYGRRHRRGHSLWGPTVHTRAPSTWRVQRLGGYPARRHGRTQVRFCGCCLPIPLFAALAAGLVQRALVGWR